MTTTIMPSMTISEIIADLSDFQEGILPTDALHNAAQQWHECWPEIRTVMQQFSSNPSSLSEAQNNLLFMGVLLAVQQQEYQAYPLFLTLCDRDDQYDSELEAVFGDALTELFPSFFYILSQNDIDLLNQLIGSQSSGGYVKSAAMFAIFAKYESGQITHDKLVQFIRAWLDLFVTDASEVSAHFLASLAASCIDHDLQQFKQELVELATDFKIDPDYISPMEIEDWLAMEQNSIKSGFIRTQFNVIDELSHWAAYRTPEENKIRQAELLEKLTELRQNSPQIFDDMDELADDWIYDMPPMPYIAPDKIGRNDPCPCGSGKKYKKCCME
ncbi:DUF1186 domain-containing protein [Paraglaciecola hydrolytica]|uniref:SecC motif-containing protein n=1 Tax=Paraglaciecola hydrolytica TaxID=1799789 RepID=A0A136A155_9ALTE|nr:DUF1186 domain-containing protein [Paraglaciecola hydrolytica]KXI28959.1 hypothetical protein AX660_12320 [Paraglaciecola hydrolytica]